MKQGEEFKELSEIADCSEFTQWLLDSDSLLKEKIIQSLDLIEPLKKLLNNLVPLNHWNVPGYTILELLTQAIEKNKTKLVFIEGFDRLLSQYPPDGIYSAI